MRGSQAWGSPSRPVLPRYARSSYYGEPRAAGVASRGLGCPGPCSGAARPDPRSARERRRRLDSSRCTNPARRSEKPRVAKVSGRAFQPMTVMVRWGAVLAVLAGGGTRGTRLGAVLAASRTLGEWRGRGRMRAHAHAHALALAQQA